MGNFFINLKIVGGTILFLYKYLHRMLTRLADIFGINILSRWLGLLFVGVALNLGAISITQAATNCNAVEENSEIPKTECEFLLRFYHKTGGVSWTQNDGWLDNNEPCDWYGINCENGHVTKISLSWNNLSGMIPLFNDLPNLQELDIENYRLCKHPHNSYGKWQSEIDQFFHDCGIIAAFDVSSDRGCVDINPSSTFEVKLDATPSINFNGNIDRYHWASNGQPLSGDSSIITVDYEDIDEHKVGLFVEYGNADTISNNDAQRIITVNECLYRLTVKKSGEGSGVVTDDQNIYCGDVCSKSYGLGYVNLNARSDDHSVFNGWTGACLAEGINPSCTVTMDLKKEVRATFDLDQHFLNVQVNDSDGGNVVSEQFGINCNPNCEESYEHGTEITLTAHHQNNYTFVGWSGSGCYETNPCVVTMDQDRKVTATFERVECALNVTNNGGGIVTCNGGTCEKKFNCGDTIKLTATPAEGYAPVKWEGDCAGECFMDQDKSVTATFIRLPKSLKVTVKGKGTVSSSPPGINDCSYSCDYSYDYGTSITLTPKYAEGYAFVRWEGNCAGTCTMDQDRNVTAIFEPDECPLTINTSGEGTVTCNGDTCEKKFICGEIINLNARGTNKYTFTNWAGDCEGTHCEITITKDRKNVTAVFLPPNILEVESVNCTVASSNVSGISCGTDCNEQYSINDEIILIANPIDIHHDSVSWDSVNNCSGNSCTVTLNEHKKVKATCALKNYVLEVNNTNPDMGTIEIKDGNNLCDSNTCSYPANNKAPVYLTAQPNAGFKFGNWMGTNCEGPNNCPVNMNKDQTITVNWKEIPPCTYELKHTNGNRRFEAIGGDGTVFVEAKSQSEQQQCSWIDENDCDWLDTSPEGNTLHYRSANGNPESDTRVCTLTIKDSNGEYAESFIITQKGNKPPKAIISKDGSNEDDNSLTITLSGNRSYDLEGDITSYTWSSIPPAYPEGSTFTFNKTEKIQRYDITLTVTDKFGKSDTDDYVVVVSEKPAVDLLPCVARFDTNISKYSTLPLGTSPLTVELNAVESENITSYEWSTFDGQTTFGFKSQLTFEQRGTHVITLTTICSPEGNNTAQEEVTVLMEPVASFIAYPNKVKLSEAVTLEASDSIDYDGDIINYQWVVVSDSGIEIQDKEMAQVTFETAGEYEIKLVVIDNDNLPSTNLAQQTIMVVDDSVNIAPTAEFTITKSLEESDSAPMTVILDASSSTDDGTIAQWQWYYTKAFMSDEHIQIPAGEQTKWEFQEDGIYTITLTVTDTDGLTGEVKKEDIAIGEYAILKFHGLEPSYKVGDYLSFGLSGKLDGITDKVDLWVAIQFPDGGLYFANKPFLKRVDIVSEPVPFRRGLSEEDDFDKHNIFPTLKVEEYYKGAYTIYAAYIRSAVYDKIKECKDDKTKPECDKTSLDILLSSLVPFSSSLVSNMIQKTTTLASE
jgi:hypothetical protein